MLWTDGTCLRRLPRASHVFEEVGLYPNDMLQTGLHCPRGQLLVRRPRGPVGYVGVHMRVQEDG